MDERRSRQERRRTLDRRNGLDRRGSGVGETLTTTKRAYVFRDFTSRRTAQDRRLYDADGGWDRRQNVADDVDAVEPEIGNEELAILFNRAPRS